MFFTISFFKINVQVLMPFTSLKWLIGYYSALAVASFIVWVVGAALLSMSTFCVATAPVLYSYSTFLVASYAIAFFIVIVYLIKLKFGGNIAALVKEQMRQPTQEELEERIFRKNFSEYDKDALYQISKDDVAPLLQVLGVFVPDEELGDLIKNLDRENTGFVKFDTMFEWFKKLNAMSEDAAAGEADNMEDDGFK
jgi:hypothetical protein